MASCMAKLIRGELLIFTVINAFCAQQTLPSSYISSLSLDIFFYTFLHSCQKGLLLLLPVSDFTCPLFCEPSFTCLCFGCQSQLLEGKSERVGLCLSLFLHCSHIKLLFLLLSVSVYYNPSLTANPPPPSRPLSTNRKQVNMNKTPITYRQEKSHLGSMERSFTDQSTLQEDERMALSFMDAHTCGTRGKTNALRVTHSAR